MTGPKPGQVELTLDKYDLVTLVKVASELNPDAFVSPKTKALLYKIKAVRADTEKSPYDTVYIWMNND